MNNITDNPTEDHEKNTPTPLRFWEIDSCFRCPVVGLCLTEVEQINALKKAGVPFKNKSAFEIHELMVVSAGGESQLSRRINHTLSQKFGAELAGHHAQDEKSFLRHWRERFQTGDYLSAFWAAVTRRDLSPEARMEIFGMIHMSMHKTADEHSRNRRRLACLESEMALLERKYKNVNAERRRMQKENEELARKLYWADRRIQTLIRQVETERSEQACAQSTKRLECETPSRDQIEEKTRRICELETKFRDAGQTIERLEGALERHKRQRELWEEASQNALQRFFVQNRCTSECPSFNLCQKRILIVGGIARMEAYYRRLIEEVGGILEYHEGHIKNGTRQLENSLKRADIVLCPVNCNSHAACSLVKNLGKKHNKPVYMMSNFSLSAVSRALTEKITGKTPQERMPIENV